ncbi:MAG: NAD(P)-dependent oxidoreductase [Candidatus Thermoplasmatota archaeon]|nr:NAD(P)-dependent oxidoreductase [Candidatus Thermoplasmatota archaeon]
MNVLVTGASGFIGSALVKRLTTEGFCVRALIHNTPPAELDCQVRYIVADVTDPQSLTTAVQDVDVVFHCAALVKDYGSTREILNVNYQGTRHLVEYCGTRLQRFIYLGHLHTTQTRRVGAYSRSKALAEDYLLQQHQRNHFPVVIIRPGNVYGPGQATWVLRPLRAIQHDRLLLIDHGKGIFLHTYIDNLIDALVTSMHAPSIIGETIDITDGDATVTWKQYLNSLAKVTGKPPLTKSLSKTTALLLGYGLQLSARLTHKEPLLTPMAVHLFTRQCSVSLEKAAALLGYHPSVEYEEAMERIRIWLKTHHYI